MDIAKIGVLGAGTMGAGIAISTVMGGYETVLSDTSAAALERAQAKLAKFANRQAEKGRMTQEEAEQAVARLTVSPSMEGLGGSDLVIEAVFEDLEVKKSVFARLEAIVSPACILATNTSALKVTDIAEALGAKARFCGLHFFSPAEINPVVEVIQGAATDDGTMDAVPPVLTRCRKSAIRCADQSGFALNRFFCPYTNEAVRCLEEGLGSHAQIDAVAKEALGVAIGPFAVMNIVKPSINLSAVRTLSHLGAFYAAAPAFIRCGEAAALWEIGSDDPAPAQDKADAIADRLRGAVFFAVLDEIAEGVARPEDIDTGAEKAFTFAQGPAAMMRDLGYDETMRLLKCAGGESAAEFGKTLSKLLA